MKRKRGCSENLYLTAMGRITRDDHHGEQFGEGDDILMTKEELISGIWAKDLVKRIYDILERRSYNDD